MNYTLGEDFSWGGLARGLAETGLDIYQHYQRLQQAKRMAATESDRQRYELELRKLEAEMAELMAGSAAQSSETMSRVTKWVAIGGTALVTLLAVTQ